MRTYGVNGFKAYIRNHIKLGHLFASLAASRPDIFRIITPPVFALTVISIIPRVPALLRQYMTIKAREWRLEKEPRSNRVSHVNGQTKMNETVHVNGESEANGEAIVNRKAEYQEKFSIIGEPWAKEEAANGRPKINGFSRINSMSESDENGSTDGESHSNGESEMSQESVFNRKLDFDRKIHINGDHKTRTVPQTNGEPKINGTTHINGESQPPSLPMTNGEPKINGTTHINGEPKSPSLPMTNGYSIANSEATSCAEEWYTEYANLVTKAVYDRVSRQGEIMLTSTVIGGLFVIRVNSANPKTEEKYLRRAFEILVAAAEEVLDQA